MHDTVVDALVLDLLEWIGPGTRPYAEVLDAWRTSCPGLPVWEEARLRGLVEVVRTGGANLEVAVSDAGRRQLEGVRPKVTPGEAAGLAPARSPGTVPSPVDLER